MKHFSFSVLLVGSVAFMLLAAGLVALVAYQSVSYTNQAETRAAADVAANLPAAQTKATRELDALVRVVGAGEPQYKWHELVCVLGTDTQVYTVNSHKQLCVIDSRAFIATTDQPDDKEECNQSVLPQEVQENYDYRPEATRGTAQECASWIDAASIGYTAAIGTTPTKILLSENKPENLEGSGTWIVIRTSTPVSSTDLGCAKFSVLGCSSVLNEPAVTIR